MTQNYDDAVMSAEALWAYTSIQGPAVEKLVAIGYRAGLQDAVAALNAAGAVGASNEGSRRLYAITKEKLASLARKFETRAKELKV